MKKSSRLIPWIVFSCFIAACSGKYDPERPLYQYRWGFPNRVQHPPKRVLKPLDMAKEKMAVEAYDKISLGVGIVVASIAIGLLLSYPGIHKLSQMGIAGGGTWAAIGLTKLFVAQYLIWFMWFAGLAIMACIVYRWRKCDVRRVGKWFGSLRKIR